MEEVGECRSQEETVGPHRLLEGITEVGYTNGKDWYDFLE
jgi:hypothetical protein